MHRYDCPQCNLTSAPFWRRSQAEDKGAEHRDNRHDGMHPKGESIIADVFRVPGRTELRPIVALVVIALAVLVSKML